MQIRLCLNIIMKHKMMESGQAAHLQVLEGRVGYLFLNNDTNRIVEQTQGQYPLSLNALCEIASRHHARHVFLEKLGGQYVHAVIPNKESALRCFLPDAIQFERFGARPVQQYMQSIAQQIWPFFYDADVLTHVGDRGYYSKQDTHWNHAGALRYLIALLAHVNDDLLQQLNQIEVRQFSSKQAGDLGSKIGLADEEIQIFTPVKRHAEKVFDNAISNDGCVRVYRNADEAVSNKAIILHDSFTSWLLDFLPELFKECMFIHTSDVDYEFIQRYAPDHVFHLQIERFFVRLPENGVSWLDYIATHERQKGAQSAFQEFCPYLFV